MTGHAGHHLMDATAKYYNVDLTGKVNNCLSCSLEKIRQKNIPKKNEDKSKNPGERMYLDISSMRKPSMGGRQHWVMLVDEATKFKKMLDMGVWRHVKRNERPNDRRLVGCRWVFKVKRNGVYRARLVAKGFSQIPGVDFTDNYSPVVNDVTFRTVVARMIIENMKGKVVDIDNAFLNGDLEHEIYMKIPEGYDEVINPGVDKEDCLILQKAIYGLVQAARQFWKKIVDKMQEGGFKLSELILACCTKKMKKGFVSS